MPHFLRKTLHFLSGFLILVGGLAVAPAPFAWAEEPSVPPSSEIPSSVVPSETLSPSATSAPPPEKVLARVGNVEITQADLQRATESFSQSLQLIPEEERTSIIGQALIDMQVIANAAEADKLEQLPEYTEQMRFLRTQALRDLYFEKKIENAITEEDVKKAYDAEYSAFEGEEEVQASHILVNSKEEAEKLIAELTKGASFEELAKEHSIGPSAEKGGDLGFFAKGQMVPEFEKAAFALEKGSYSKEPVQTQFGWHIILLKDRRVQPAPEFDVVAPQLRQKLLREKFRTVLDDLKSKEKIEILDPRLEAAQTPQGQ